jgi:arylsulfatase A-like enzyme
LRLRAALYLSLESDGFLAALLGGGAVGGLDGALAALLAPEPGLAALALPLAGAGAGALAGATLVLLLALLRALLIRIPALASPGRATRAAAVVLAAPVVVYDALAMFGGNRAARIPGRSLLSTGLALLGLGLIWLLAGQLWNRIERVQRGERPRRYTALAAGALAASAVAIYLANRFVLPNLYGWFHATLALALLVTGVLAARLGRARAAAPSTRRWLLVALGTAVACAVLGLWGVGRSHGLLFAAHERAQLVGFAVRASPFRPPRRSSAIVARRGGAEDGPALPEGPRVRDADVLLITVDALRADRVGAYGYPRPVTPNIDRLAARGVRFERAYAQAPHTSFSATSMLTGRYYPTLTRLQGNDEAASAEDVLPFHLRRYGWKTAAFYPPAVFYVEADKLRAFERNHFQFEYTKVEYMDAHARISQVAQFFEEEKPARAFLWIHFFEPHEPYDRWQGYDFGQRDPDRYDSEIAYTDAAVGRLLSYFEKNRPGTVVILTADHGEAFDEHNARYHGSSLYDEQIRVPLIIAVPGVPAHVVPGPVEMVDIAPTVLGLLDIPIPVRMRGTDLGPWLRSPPAPAERLGYAFAEFEDTRMVASPFDKLICETKKGFCEYYDLRSDPGERHSRVEQNPARVNLLRGELEAWFAEQTRFALPPRKAAGPIVLERAQMGDPTVVDQVAALLAVGNPTPVRAEAARLLATTLPARPDIAGALRAAMTDTEVDVRAWAAVALARQGDAEARKQLRAQVAAEGPVRLPAAMVLAEAGDAAAVVPLGQELALCKEAAVCRPIVEALGRLRDRRATAPLLSHLVAVMGRRETVVALGEIRDPAAVPALVERLTTDEYVTVRAAAAEALGKLGPLAGEAARTALQSTATRESEPLVLAAARAALERIGGARAGTRSSRRPPSPPAP